MDKAVAAMAMLGHLSRHDLNRSATELVASLVARPWGQVSASIYETGRVVSLAPRVRDLSEARTMSGFRPKPGQQRL
jgi:hypothetical protein